MHKKLKQYKTTNNTESLNENFGFIYKVKSKHTKNNSNSVNYNQDFLPIYQLNPTNKPKSDSMVKDK